MAVDTAGQVVGVAVVDAHGARSRSARIDRGAEGWLLPAIQEICPEGLAAIDGVVVATGPGAFTGLRVGLAAASGLALSLNVPVVPLSSLASRAGRVGGGRVLAVLDARKSRLYAALYEDDVLVRGPADAAPDDVLAWTPLLGLTVTGEGVRVVQDRLLASGATLAPEWDDPAVETLGRMGRTILMNGGGIPAWDVRPVYLRDADVAMPRNPGGLG